MKSWREDDLKRDALKTSPPAMRQSMRVVSRAPVMADLCM